MNQLSTLRCKYAARLFVFTWFFIGGIAHFAIPEPFLRIMPPYIPFHLACGAFELLGVFALWFRPLRSYAGYGLMLLTAIVTLHTCQRTHVSAPRTFPEHSAMGADYPLSSASLVNLANLVVFAS